VLPSDATSTLIYGTTYSLICVLDLRTMRVVQSMENPRHLGAITALLVDRKRTWVLTGTATGVLILWDLRFGLRVRTWRVGIASSFGSAEGPNILSLAPHPTKGKGRWVIVALQSRTPAHSETEGIESESTQAEVWDIEHGILVERYLSTQTAPSQDNSEPLSQSPPEASVPAEDISPAAAIAALVRMRQVEAEAYARPVMTGGPPPPPPAESRALLVGVDLGGAAPRSDMIVDLSVEGVNTPRRRGYMITGAADRRLRLWNLNQVDNSVVLSGPPSEAVDESPLYSSR
jgi:phosphoinositide-3-kinase regulatory subunit 4